MKLEENEAIWDKTEALLKSWYDGVPELESELTPPTKEALDLALIWVRDMRQRYDRAFGVCPDGKGGVGFMRNHGFDPISVHVDIDKNGRLRVEKYLEHKLIYEHPGQEGGAA